MPRWTPTPCERVGNSLIKAQFDCFVSQSCATRTGGCINAVRLQCDEHSGSATCLRYVCMNWGLYITQCDTVVHAGPGLSLDAFFNEHLRKNAPVSTLLSRTCLLLCAATNPLCRR